MMRATSLPIRPKPKTPMVLPASVLPAMAGQSFFAHAQIHLGNLAQQGENQRDA